MLTALGIEFEVVEPRVEEVREGDPEEIVLENARRKAQAGAELAPGALVLGADTEVVLEGRALGKAAGPEEARAHLEALSGRTHEVLGGLVLLDPSAAGPEPAERSGVARSRVSFEALDEPTIALYLSSGEWRDRAGAYAIQGLGAILVKRMEGDFSNVVGLPVRLLIELAPELLSP
jgi:septum formation protein